MLAVLYRTLKLLCAEEVAMMVTEEIAGSLMAKNTRKRMVQNTEWITIDLFHRLTITSLNCYD